MSKKTEAENPDDPYDSVKIQQYEDGTYCVVFYIAVHEHSRAIADWPSDTLETLTLRQAHYREQGTPSPLTDRALRLLRQAMKLPELH